MENIRRKGERKMENRKETGITLIALVVTIIVLIILAGVSIAMIVGDNGIISEAQRAARETANATIASEEQMNVLIDEMNQQITGNTEEETEIELSELKVGNYILYNSGTNGEILCKVLYPVDSEYGLQIITDKTVKDITMGGTTFEEGRTSYNNAIEKLNDESENYVNSNYVADARSVGSIPTIENEKFKDKDKGTETTVTLPPPVAEGEDVSTWWTNYTRPSGWQDDDTGGYNLDTNYATDESQLKNFNMWIIGKEYWLASRNVDVDSTRCLLRIRYVFPDGNLYSKYFSLIHSNGTIEGDSATYGLRPCFLLKSNIQIVEGNGSEEKPYKIK